MHFNQGLITDWR